MDETKEILTNEEVVETVDGVVEATSDMNEGKLGIGLLIGTAITGVCVIAGKYIIKPGIEKLSSKIKELKSKKTEDDSDVITEEDFEN